MEHLAFLLNMSISGIKSIEKEIYIDFYGKTINKSFNPDKNKVKGIYGENGSGKSAIISAVDLVKNILLNENYLRDSQQQFLLKELINKKSKEFHFNCEYLIDIESRLIYEYDIVLKFNKADEIVVSRESLKYKEKATKNVQKVLFVCENGEFLDLNYSENNKKIIIDKTRNLLTKQSALSSVFMMGDAFPKKELNLFYTTISMLFFILLDTYFDREDKHIDYFNKNIIESMKKSGLPKEKMFEELSKRTSIYDNRVPVKIFKKYGDSIKRLEDFIRLFKPDLKKIEIEKKRDKDYYICNLIMNYGSYKVHREFESTGIKKIMNLYNLFKRASMGGIVFIDELDSNINDIYLCKLIEYFKLYGKGQICFTSHNTDPMQVLKDNNKSIDFLTRDNQIIPWVKNSHYSPDNLYKSGMIMGLPFNIDASDFIRIFEVNE